MADVADAPKKATNLSLNAKTLALARELGINLSQTVDELLAKEVTRRAVERWVENNPETVAAYNRRVRDSGLWNDDLRKMRGQI
jgi:antitoxin CcdA